MSIVNLKIIFVKKQKQTLERPTQGRGATFIITVMAVFPGGVLDISPGGEVRRGPSYPGPV